MFKYFFAFILIPCYFFPQITPELEELLKVPVLKNPNLSAHILPNQRFCFDKMVHIKTLGSSRPSETYFYINTKEGYYATRTGRLGTLGDGSLNVNDENFSLNIFSKKGEAFSYKNRIQNKKIVHYVSTGNTDAFALQPTTFDDKPIFKKRDQETLCDGKLKTRAYKADNSPTSVYIFGDDFPDRILVKNALSYSGIGYFYSSDQKVYICAKMISEDYGFEAKSWQETDICFNAAEFENEEEAIYSKMNEDIRKQKEKLENKTYSGNCIDAKQKVVEKKKQLLDKQKENADKAKTSGNIYESIAAQRAMAGLKNYEGQLEVDILNIEVSICEAEHAKQKASDNNDIQNAERAANRIICLEGKKAQLQQEIAKMQQLDAQYASNPGKAMIEKTKLYGNIMKQNSEKCK